MPVGGLLSEWPANSHLPRFVGFAHCQAAKQASQGRSRPTNILLQLKGASGIQVLLSPATLTIPAAKLSWIEMDASALASYLQAGWLLNLALPKCCRDMQASGTEHTRPALLPISADFDEMLGEHHAAIKC